MADEVEKEPAAGVETGRRDVQVPGVVFRLRMGMKPPASTEVVLEGNAQICALLRSAAVADDPLPDDAGPHEGAPR